ncbi:Succinoglycan biosynthesis transport protein ExoP [Alteripontixanthobacter maritimus]|uniref:non-specific protein-tyrosine kinase n=1 Tax=Alteripontixanthobacter maritimus TaxID=2161824 RepID=A0A369Q5E3_9SPHN|nr:polysaccharide biosynthesis tyrosine autokinase [Alteripontixanthobacter maritimus]RDC59702.1 Succinoglycan biosynthesis transport protein ExoP [Alteripontixanthobacter maritimus]
MPEGFSLADLRAMAWRQRKMVAILAGIALIVGLIITLLQTPMYAAAATVRVDNESIRVTEGQDANPVINAFETDRYLNTLVEVVQSRAMALEVTDDLNLAQNEAFLQQMGFAPEEIAATSAADIAKLRNGVADLLQSRVVMTVPQNSRVVSITYTSESPTASAQIANAYARNFAERNASGKADANEYAGTILNQQVIETRAALQEAEVAAVEYARRNRLIFAEGGTAGDNEGNAAPVGQSIVAANLTSLNQAYADARARRILAEQRFRGSRGVDALSLPEAQQNGSLQNLLQQRASTQAELRQLRERYLADYPAVQQTQAKLNTLQGQIDAAAQQVRTSIKTEYEVAQRQESELDAARSELANETLGEQDRRVQFNLLTRDADNLRERLSDLQRRAAEIAGASDVDANNIRVLDPAGVPSGPVSPSLPKNMAISLILGLLVGGGLAVLREASDDTLYSPDDVERTLNVPLLGSTPLVDTVDTDDLEDAKSDIAEAYYSIRAAIDMATGGSRKKMLQVTSCQPGEGKSTTSLAIAQDFGNIGRRVLLVDCDLRKPSLHKIYGIPNERGLMDVLATEVTLEEGIRRAGTGGSNHAFDFIPLGTRPTNPAQILSTQLLPDLLAQLQDEYDVIMLDSAPVMGLADAPMLSRTADHTIVVTEAGRASTGQTRTAMRRLTENGANIAGVVMTKFDFRQAGYSYDYHYSYYSYGDEAEAG